MDTNKVLLWHRWTIAGWQRRSYRKGFGRLLVNCNVILREDKSFVNDLNVQRGIVSSRVALLLRSAEIKPLLSDLLFFLILFGTVVLKDLDLFFYGIRLDKLWEKFIEFYIYVSGEWPGNSCSCICACRNIYFFTFLPLSICPLRCIYLFTFLSDPLDVFFKMSICPSFFFRQIHFYFMYLTIFFFVRYTFILCIWPNLFFLNHSKT